MPSLTVLRYAYFFCSDTATTEIYTLSLHDALPIYGQPVQRRGHQLRAGDRADGRGDRRRGPGRAGGPGPRGRAAPVPRPARSEEHTSELQSRQYLVCRLLLAKKPNTTRPRSTLTRT